MELQWNMLYYRTVAVDLANGTDGAEMGGGGVENSVGNMAMLMCPCICDQTRTWIVSTRLSGVMTVILEPFTRLKRKGKQ